MRIVLFLLSVMITSSGFAADATVSRGKMTISSDHIARVVTLFKEVSRLASAPSPTATATECGYIFPGDSSKFGCKGSGKAAADVAAACSGGGSLACTGSGSGRTCTCAFD